MAPIIPVLPGRAAIPTLGPPLPPLPLRAGRPKVLMMPSHGDDEPFARPRATRAPSPVAFEPAAAFPLPVLRPARPTRRGRKPRKPAFQEVRPVLPVARVVTRLPAQARPGSVRQPATRKAHPKDGGGVSLQAVLPRTIAAARKATPSVPKRRPRAYEAAGAILVVTRRA